MKDSTSEYLLCAGSLAMLAGTFAFELVKEAVVGGNTSVSRVTATYKLRNQWEKVTRHYESGKSFKLEGK